MFEDAGRPGAADVLRRLLADSEQPDVEPSRTGGPRSVTNTGRLWRQARGDGEFAWVTPHVFRRTVGTAVAHSMDIESAAEQLGNTPAVARRHYVESKRVAPDVRGVLDGLGPAAGLKASG